MTRVTLDCGGEKRALRVLENNNTLPPSPCPSSTSTTTPNCSPPPPLDISPHTLDKARRAKLMIENY